MDCAKSGLAEPSTLLRAVRDFCNENPKFSTKVAIAALENLLRGGGYEPPTPADVLVAYDCLTTVAEKADLLDWAKAEVGKIVLKGSGCDPLLRKALMNRL